MFIVIYSFKVKAEFIREFESTWREMTNSVKNLEGSFGSRLHKKDEQNYIAYAQWLNKNTWLNSRSNLSNEVEKIRTRMRSCCEQIEIAYELEVVDDLIELK